MTDKFIDSHEDHVRVLAELGQLDDTDDWEAYKRQEALFDQDIDLGTWFKYVKVP